MESKTRAKLRAMANGLAPSVIIGKDGITDTLVRQISIELDARELVKISVLSNEVDHKEILNKLAQTLNAEPISQIGKKMVLYRFSPKKNIKHILEDN